MQIPDAAAIREASNVVFAEYGYPEPESGADRLQPKVDEAVSWLIATFAAQGETLNLLDLDGDSPQGVLAGVAIRMLTEYAVASSVQEIVDTVADFDLLSAWSAGPVSETRRDVSPNASVLHPWPELNRLLGALLAITRGAPEGLDPRVPVFSHVDPMVPKPGVEIMGWRRQILSIYGDLVPPGVIQTWRPLV
jgi:hypothetical protein